MSATKKLEYNQRYSWDEMASAYQDMWVFLTNVTFSGVYDIKDAILLEVSSFEDKEEVYARLIKEHSDLVCRRTTYRGPTVGVLC